MPDTPPLPHKHSFDSLSERYGARYKWLVLFAVAFGGIAGVLSTSSMNVAIPSIGQQFGLGQDKVQWAITGFMAAMTLSMLPTPWLLDRIGFRRCFLGAIAVLAASSALGALATSFAWLVAMRLVQGAAAGILQPLGAVAVMRLFPVESQGRASGILGFSIVLAPAVAPTLGGMLLDRFGWEAIILANLPFCLIAGVAGMALLPHPRELKNTRFDWFGAGTLGLATLCAIEGITSVHGHGLTSPWTLSLLGLAALALVLFVRHARRAQAPIIAPALFANRAFTMGTLVSLTYGFGMYASTYLIPVFLQSALGYSATRAGLALLPAGLVLALVIPLGGRMADRYPPHRVTMLGLAVFGLSFLLLTVIGGRIAYDEMIWVTALGRLGLALILPALSLAALRGMTAHQLGQSSVVVSYVRQLGGVLGIAVSSVFVEWRETAYGAVGPGAYADSFMLLAVVFVVALAAASRMTPHTEKVRKAAS